MVKYTLFWLLHSICFLIVQRIILLHALCQIGYKENEDGTLTIKIKKPEIQEFFKVREVYEKGMTEVLSFLNKKAEEKKKAKEQNRTEGETEVHEEDEQESVLLQFDK